jgi:gliding motility-associated-like protein
MASDNFIDEIASKLREHNSEVNAQLWQGIHSQIATGGATASGGLSLVKIASIVAAVMGSVAIVYFVVVSSVKEKKKEFVQTSNLPSTKDEDPAPEQAFSKTTKKSEPTSTSVMNKRSVSRETTKQPVFVSEPAQNKESLERTTSPILAPEIVLPTVDKINKVEPKRKETVQLTEDKQKEPTPKVVEPAVVKPFVVPHFINLPNIFTPNNDGVNDQFFVQVTGIYNYQLIVLDAKSKVVWSTNDPNQKWDGYSLGGEKLPNGSYLYFITAEDEAGNPVNQHKRLEIK